MKAIFRNSRKFFPKSRIAVSLTFDNPVNSESNQTPLMGNSGRKALLWEGSGGIGSGSVPSD
jgi:hypothetical protein